VFKADSASITQLALGTVLSTGNPGPGGLPLSAAGAPAPKGAGGAHHVCSRGCGFDSRIPLESPAYALVSGSTVSMQLECSAACHGSGTLRYPPPSPTAPHASGAILAAFHFQLLARGAMTVTGTLTPRGIQLLATRTRLIVGINIVFTPADGRQMTYENTLVLTRSGPSGQLGTPTPTGPIVLPGLG
jgi:hypothetical protein